MVMFQSFFGRRSRLVRTLRILVWLELLAIFYRRGVGPLGAELGWMTWLVAVSWLAFNLLDWIPWYSGGGERAGIRIHFQRNLVPVSYLLAPGLLLPLGGFSDWFLLPAALVCLFLHHVDGLLLYLHFRDSSRMRPGYFSFNHYLREEEPTCSR